MERTRTGRANDEDHDMMMMVMMMALVMMMMVAVMSTYLVMGPDDDEWPVEGIRSLANNDASLKTP